ncbi:MAG: siphovirus Gp157 family protein [Cytophagaceae bacterium]|nr:siphovirus Gp157 family protein [Cytophagaceae bacterium]
MTQLSKSLFKIREDLAQLVNDIEESGGVVDEDQIKALQIGRNELQAKGLNYVHIIKKLENDLELAKIYEENIKAFKKRKENAIQRLKDSLLDAVNQFGDIETDIFKITTRKSESVEIVSEEELPMFCFRTKTEKVIDKVKIKEALKAGENVPGAELRVNKNLSIK